MDPVKRVCFVCLGNIVRSPLAENLFRSLAEQRGAGERYVAGSAGTGAWHVGEPPDARMRRVAARHGLSYNGRARQFQTADFGRYDLILALDRENYSELNHLAKTETQRRKIRMLREFDPLGSPQASVPDPYYEGLEGFEEVYAMIERSVNGLLDALEAGRLG